MKPKHKLTRVKSEVLSGEVTNETDLIDAALIEYAHKVKLYKEKGLELNPNEPLTITQFVDVDVDTNSHSKQELAITGLLLVDENGNEISAATASTYYGSNTNTSNALSLTSVITLYVQVKVEDGDTYYTASRITNRLTGECPTGMTLTQYFSWPDVSDPVYDSKVTSNPPASVTINFYPDDPWHPLEGSNPHLKAWSIVRYLSDELYVGVYYDPNVISEYRFFPLARAYT